MKTFAIYILPVWSLLLVEYHGMVKCISHQRFLRKKQITNLNCAMH